MVELGFESCHSGPTNLVANIEARPEMAVLTKRKVLTEAEGRWVGREELSCQVEPVSEGPDPPKQGAGQKGC